MFNRRNISVSDLSKYMAREAYFEDEQIQRIKEVTPEESIVTGNIVGPLKPISKSEGSYILRAEKAYFSRFRVGDRVEIAEIDPRTKKLRKIKESSIRMLRFPEPGVIEFLLPGDDLIFKNEGEVFLLPTSFSGIKWNLLKRLRAIKASGLVAKNSPIERSAVLKNFNEISENLNSTQQEALRFLIDNDLKGLIQGPPGTGKTHLLVDLIRLAIKSNLRVGLASLTHTAVDNALSRVLKSGVDVSEVVRVAGERHRLREELYKGYDINEIWGGSFRRVCAQTEFDQGNDYRLYAATLHTWCLTTRPPEIDVLIIDEASQVPIYFYPFLESICSRKILFGDHKQLPPVIQITRHNLPSEDIFSFEIEGGKYPMLETQYRMNEGVQEWSSNRFYHGRLKPDESNRRRDIIRGLDTLSGRFGSESVNLISHSGRCQYYTNRYEASRVADLVWALKTEGSLSLKEIGIVAPHRAQAIAISAYLQDKLGLSDMQKILVDTVERFQGQEREAVILSMGVEKDNSRKGDEGFLGDGRRLNVAVTRARSRFYCVAPSKLIENTRMQKNAAHLNSFLEWCGASNRSGDNEEIA